ncbi:MAG: DUF4249 domain-containing protein [Sphingobacteriaceae bacterium]|nr:MAG: DUF4249 domain-containing protein [Sphingobacteriaceae bacterium]
MKNHQPKIITILALAMLFLSCTKVIDIDFKNAAEKLVVEGNVTNFNSTQTVKLSKSMAVTDASNFSAISGATVTITSDGRVYPLLEKSPGTYVTTTLKGQSAKTYQLNVVSGNQTYTATSTMPNVVRLDSLGLNATTFVNKETFTPTVYYTDPAATTNYYRFVLTVNNIPSKEYFIYNDELTNGRVINRDLRDFDADLNVGDRISVEMQSIDKNIYQYFNGLSQNENRGGASITPANPISNVSNGALGYFSAHTVQIKQFVIK